MNKLKIYIYIILIIFIFASIMQKLVLTQKYIDSQAITTRVLLTNNLQDCFIKTIEYSFFLPNCDQFEAVSLLEVVSSLSNKTDKSFFSPKRLEVQAVNQFQIKRASVKYWWSRAKIWSRVSKSYLLERIEPYLPSTHFSLVEGMVFGGATQLSQDLQRDFRVTGLTHVVSASGYNVSVVASLILVIFKKIFPRRVAGLVAIVMVWIYALMAEMVPPVIRASIMISINLIAAQVFLRQYQVLFVLFLAIAIMLYFQPFYAHSLSFWLSTLATLGIILILPLLESNQGVFQRLSTGQLAGENNPSSTNIFLESLRVTLAAQSLTLPLVAMVFGEVSLLSFLTNTFLLWMTPLITLSGLGLMVLGAITSLVPGLWGAMAPVVNILVWLPTTLFLFGVEWFGQLEWGYIKISLSWWAVLVWWGLLGVVILRKKYQMNRKVREGNLRYATFFGN
jgi:ComEC/Rec2-related protein